MARRSISAILWTLVSVNVITLVVGGLITWLSYTIPARLKHLGLLPELVMVAGSASLVVACIGLCALNYSSHHALNVYSGSCAVLALTLVLPGIPQSWYKSDHYGNGNVLLDVAHFSLLFILVVLSVFSFTFAQYLRHKQMSSKNSLDAGCNPLKCTCNNMLQHYHYTAQDNNQIEGTMTLGDGYMKETSSIITTRSNTAHRLRDFRSNFGGTNESGAMFASNNSTGDVNRYSSDQIANPSTTCPSNTSQYLPLVHKGYYHHENFTEPRDVEPPTATALQLDKSVESRGDNDSRAGSCECRCSYNASGSDKVRNASADDNMVHATRDDSSVEYRHREQQQHYQMTRQAKLHLPSMQTSGLTQRFQSIPGCNCHLGNSIVSLAPKIKTDPSGYNNLLIKTRRSPYTMPRLSNSNTYAIKSKPKGGTSSSSK